MSDENLIYLVSAEATERESLTKYFKRHEFNVSVFAELNAARDAAKSKAPQLIVLAGSSIPSPDICTFGAEIEQLGPMPIIALLTKLQMSIVSEMAQSENLLVAEYPISLREVRASVVEALDELAG